MRLLYLDTEGIERIVKEYDGTTIALKEELLRICWCMRGGIDYNISHMLSIEERTLISKIVEKNLETTKESGLPFF
jgi:hypothetical protein